MPTLPPLNGGSPDSVGDPAVLGVLTVSDRAAAGEYEDLGGPAILGFFAEAVLSPCVAVVVMGRREVTAVREAGRRAPRSPPPRWTAVYRVVPDDRPTIEAALKAMADGDGCAVIVTTGGTGPAPRDVTPDATAAVCDRVLPGFGEQMRAIGLRHVPTAVLSRQVGGTRGACLILNLPGAPKSIRETVDEVFAAVPTCVDLVGGPYLEVGGPVASFRPKGLVRPPRVVLG